MKIRTNTSIMSAFEVEVTPYRNKLRKRTESREPTRVLIGVLSPKAIVQFIDIPVTETAKRIVNIINPTEKDIDVEVTMQSEKELNLTTDWMEKTISVNSSAMMELTWVPEFECSERVIIHLFYNHYFCKDIVVILNSEIQTKPIKKGIKRKSKSIYLATNSTSKKFATENNNIQEIHQSPFDAVVKYAKSISNANVQTINNFQILMEDLEKLPNSPKNMHALPEKLQENSIVTNTESRALNVNDDESSYRVQVTNNNITSIQPKELGKVSTIQEITSNTESAVPYLVIKEAQSSYNVGLCTTTNNKLKSDYCNRYFSTSILNKFCLESSDSKTKCKRSWTSINKNSTKNIEKLELKKIKTLKLQKMIYYNTDLSLPKCINLNPFAASTICDPFFSSTVYLDKYSIENCQKNFIKWLNAVTIQIDTDSNIKIGFFNELPPKKQEYRLEPSRQRANQLFLSEEMRPPCWKIITYNNKTAMRVRNDRNLYVDEVMQRYILELLLHINPFWLRLGLEVVFAKKIDLKSSSTVSYLSAFILNRLLREETKASALSKVYSQHIHQFILQEILHLPLFLDKEKNYCIIKHNPCLFVKNSPHQENKTILLKISSELLNNVGDVMRDLKCLRYTLQHKQSYADNFDFALKNIEMDSRDGIRPTPIVKIILMRDDLIKQLRTPAIELALSGHKEEQFHLNDNINAVDIGHQKKTLFLLWQMIYKFRAPKLHDAAVTIQNCWRRFIFKRQIALRDIMKSIAAATIIQAHYREHLARKFTNNLKYKQILTKYIQRNFMCGYMPYKHCKQAHYRSHGKQLCLKYHKQYFKLRTALRCALHLRWLRYYKQQLIDGQRHNKAAIQIQRYWQSFQTVRQRFLCKQKSAIIIQTRYRAWITMKAQRDAYKKLQDTTIMIQRHRRAKFAIMKQREHFLWLVKYVLTMVQLNNRILQMLKKNCDSRRLNKIIVQVQRRFRNNIAMRYLRTSFLRLRTYVIAIQQSYRARRLQRVHAIIALQRRYRADRLMVKQRADYLKLKATIILVQRRIRANLQMRYGKAEFDYYFQILIQLQQFCAMQQFECGHYQKLANCIISFQAHIHSYITRKRFGVSLTNEKNALLRRRKAATIIQSYYRGYKDRAKNQNVQINNIRRNINMLKKKPDVSVHSQIQNTIRFLLARKVKESSQVLKELYRLSRIVPHLLINQTDFICTLCYRMIAQSLYSEIDKRLILSCSRIILNLARFHNTSANTFQESGLVSIAQILLQWCDKDTYIFNTLCTLIWVFVQFPQKKKVIRKFISSPQAIEVLREIKKRMARRKMILNLYMPPDKLRFKSHLFGYALPNLKPDYGIVKFNPYTFLLSSYALDTILCKLDIKLY